MKSKSTPAAAKRLKKKILIPLLGMSMAVCTYSTAWADSAGTPASAAPSAQRTPQHVSALPVVCYYYYGFEYCYYLYGPSLVYYPPQVYYYYW